MMSNLESRAAAVILIAVLALSMTVIGCGTDDEREAEEHFGRVRRESSPEPAVAQAPAAGDESASETAPVPERPAVEPAPPKEVTYEEAEAAYHDRRYEEAMDLFTLYTEQKSGNPWGYYMLGLSAWKAGQYATAKEALELALELDPRHVKSWINLSRVLLDDGRPEEAIAKIDSALAIDPGLDVAHRLQGRVFHQLGRPDEAIDSYRKAIGIDNNDAWSMNNMGLILIEQGRFEDALGPLARAVELDPDVAIFRNNLGMALEHTGHVRAAEDAYTAAVEIDETYAKAYANMVRIAEVDEDPGIQPVDLAALARGFAQEIAGWTVAATEGGPPATGSELEGPPAPAGPEAESAEPDSMTIDDTEIATADSTGSGRE